MTKNMNAVYTVLALKRIQGPFLTKSASLLKRAPKGSNQGLLWFIFELQNSMSCQISDLSSKAFQ